MTLAHLSDPDPPDGERFRDDVHARARRYLIRRRGGQLAAASLASVLVALAVATVGGASEPGTDVVTRPAGQPVSPSEDEVATSTETTAAPTTTVAAVAPAPSTTTLPAKVPVTTVPAAPPQAVDCESADWRIEAHPGQSSYASGEKVSFTVTARNVSAKTCRRPAPVEEVVIRDSDGRGVAAWTEYREYGQAGGGSSGSDGVAPGGQWIDNVYWDQRGCAGPDECTPSQVEPGVYTFAPRWIAAITADVEVR